MEAYILLELRIKEISSNSPGRFLCTWCPAFAPSLRAIYVRRAVLPPVEHTTIPHRWWLADLFQLCRSLLPSWIRCYMHCAALISSLMVLILARLTGVVFTRWTISGGSIRFPLFKNGFHKKRKISRLGFLDTSVWVCVRIIFIVVTQREAKKELSDLTNLIN